MKKYANIFLCVLTVLAVLCACHFSPDKAFTKENLQKGALLLENQVTEYGVPRGYGTYTWADGSEYTGLFSHGQVAE